MAHVSIDYMAVMEKTTLASGNTINARSDFKVGIGVVDV